MSTAAAAPAGGSFRADRDRRGARARGRLRAAVPVRTARLDDADRRRGARHGLGDDDLRRARRAGASGRRGAPGARTRRRFRRRHARAARRRAALRGRLPLAAPAVALGRARRGHRGGHRGDPRDRHRRTAEAKHGSRSTVLLGGTLLAAIAALQAFWPRARRRAALAGRRGDDARRRCSASRVIEVPPERAVLHGSLFALLLAAFLFADRVGTGAGRARGDLHLRRRRSPRRRSCRRSTPSGRGSTCSRSPRTSPTAARPATSWDHDYGAAPLAARRPRAAADQGASARRTGRPRCSTTSTGARGGAPGACRRSSPTARPTSTTRTGSRRSASRVRGLRSEQFVPPGQRRRPVDSPGAPCSVGGGHLRDGSAACCAAARTTRARVYTPTPTTGELATPGSRLPELRATSWLTVEIPGADGAPQPGRPGAASRSVDVRAVRQRRGDRVTTASGMPPGDDRGANAARGPSQRSYAPRAAR